MAFYKWEFVLLQVDTGREENRRKTHVDQNYLLQVTRLHNEILSVLDTPVIIVSLCNKTKMFYMKKRCIST